MNYNQLRSRYAHELEVLLDEGEITEEEAQSMMADWDAGYSDYMYDRKQDQQFEEAWYNDEM